MEQITSSQSLEIINAALKAAKNHGVPTEKIVSVTIEFDDHEFVIPTPIIRPKAKPRIIQAEVDTVSDLSPITPVELNDCNQCAADILATLEDIGHRLTTAQILTELEKKSKLWGESTVKLWLSKLVKSGKLNNRNERPCPGYGLPDWN